MRLVKSLRASADTDANRGPRGVRIRHVHAVPRSGPLGDWKHPDPTISGAEYRNSAILNRARLAVATSYRRFDPTDAAPIFRYGTLSIVLATLLVMAQIGKWWWSIPNSYACAIRSHPERSTGVTPFDSYAVRRPRSHDALPTLPFRIEWVVARSGSDRPIAYCEDRNTLSSNIVCGGVGIVIEIDKASGKFRLGIDRQPPGDRPSGVQMSESGVCEKR